MIRIIALLSISLLMFGCKLDLSSAKKTTAKNTIFIGIDVSGSFTTTDSFKNGVKFLSYYLYGHLRGEEGLSRPTDLYVGGIGGDQKEEPQSFFPIHDFDGLSPLEIEEKLTKEFSGQTDNLTDFNTFFLRIKSIVKQKNLVLAPISIIMLTDGVPEIPKGQGKDVKVVKQAYSKIDISPLEYLTRNISIRILYASPKVGNNWQSYVPTSRIKVWTVEPAVMFGWEDQLRRNGMSGLWSWVKDNIDLRIKSRGI
ncbi:MAG: hypothetical protein A2504_01515 [Bdellovibrionales bacterium RIFOXYD12_FULL_39_22]|nr:MAG: hypothetical protein A2385_04040 [Bdellovibrionales bacterium RIFOXYB1_FULL_39_21]OFZ42416.1 MAG: hypothetical protein A2485_15455 [Bdellovibrionales bacterium RIFOXYC12_FULL_39_17]OFZ46283.1 MAG: hypothetical protein A2404_13560 [Bdellovibrionales bacterium RIFOXYC1_FULL_39_130]OFZ70397.1 MAG: hypothetical protein A2451_09575 [Bdellovibrionales bacterium RIFOXYC2_FULL_39_8]OFZ75176.1 MAG: hypothetical protein A2560_15615 [Bdellovibrionales bacterium RIFOXYD1_FULL_39_84]OFZ93170.1 MAG: